MEINKVGVLGCGLMGHGIAQVAAQAGHDVVVVEIDQAALDKGLGKIEKQLGRAVEKGKLEQGDADAVLGRIDASLEQGGLADCDLIIEAITEDLGLKLEMWKQVDGIAKDGRRVRHEHLVPCGDRPGGRHGKARALPWPALLQPGSGDEAGRGRALHHHLG